MRVACSILVGFFFFFEKKQHRRSFFNLAWIMPYDPLHSPSHNSPPSSRPIKLDPARSFYTEPNLIKLGMCFQDPNNLEATCVFSLDLKNFSYVQEAGYGHPLPPSLSRSHALLPPTNVLTTQLFTSQVCERGQHCLSMWMLLAMFSFRQTKKCSHH